MAVYSIMDGILGSTLYFAFVGKVLHITSVSYIVAK